MSRLNPVLLTEQSTQKLPRALLICMVLAYALSGLIGKDPWRGDDAVGFGMAVSFAHHLGVDSLQSVANAELAQYSPLWFAWVGLFIRGLFFLPAPVAAIVPMVLSIGLAAYALWLATYYMAKTPAAQPLTLALGGQPHPVAYAKAVADGAVLLLLATLGIALPLHELTALSCHFTLLCLLLCGAAMSLESPRTALRLLACALGLLGAFIGLQALVIACLWLGILTQLHAWQAIRRALVWLVICGIAGFLIPFIWAWSWGQTAYMVALWDWNLAQWAWVSSEHLIWLLSNLPFLAWPVMPFAWVAIWRWRKHWQAPHIALGLSFIVVFLLSQIGRGAINDATVLAAIPGAVLLAAFLLPALPRTWMNAIDWFGVMLLSCMAALCWLVWLAMTLGSPAPLAHNILRLAPQLDTQVRWWALIAALMATLFWILVVRWRVLAAKTVIWRAAVIWSAGSLTVWVLMGSLFMPWFNHVKTYQPVAHAIRQVSQAVPSCVKVAHLGLPQRAALAYFGAIVFEAQPLNTTALAASAASQCHWLLDYQAIHSTSPLVLPEGTWILRWEGRRFLAKEERFRLYEQQ